MNVADEMGLTYEPYNEVVDQHREARKDLIEDLFKGPHQLEILGKMNRILGKLEMIERHKKDQAIADGIAAARREIQDIGLSALKARSAAHE